MKTEFFARQLILAALIIPTVVAGSAVITADQAFARDSVSAGGGGGGGGGGNGGHGEPGRGGGGGGGGAGNGSTAADSNCLAAPCARPRPPRRVPPPVQSVSIAPDCSCELRTVRSGGRLVRIRDCYKVVDNRLRYCEPLAQ